MKLTVEPVNSRHGVLKAPRPCLLGSWLVPGRDSLDAWRSADQAQASGQAVPGPSKNRSHGQDSQKIHRLVKSAPTGSLPDAGQNTSVAGRGGPCVDWGVGGFWRSLLFAERTVLLAFCCLFLPLWSISFSLQHLLEEVDSDTLRIPNKRTRSSEVS